MPYVARNSLACHQACNEKVTDRHQSKQEEISATTFIIEVIGKQGDKQQTRRRPALQQQINQYKSDKQPEENTTAEYHRGLRIVGKYLF